MELSNLNIKNGLCLSLGANIDSKYGSPINTLIVAKSKVEQIINNFRLQNQGNKILSTQNNKYLFWSSLYKSHPHGINEFQPDYINTLLLARTEVFPKSSVENAKFLLKEFQRLEQEFGRDKSNSTERWQPRGLDIDILWWDNLNFRDDILTIPHPRFMNRNFVITPLSEILSRFQEIEKQHIEQWDSR